MMMARHHLYGRWANMRQRCLNPNHPWFHRYGGRGIVVCDRWASFPAFLADMGDTYRPGLMLDRRDNDGPYSPANCRWVTPGVSTENRANTRWVWHGGEKIRLVRAAKIFGITLQSARERVEVLGDDTATWPPRQKYTRKRALGHQDTRVSGE